MKDTELSTPYYDLQSKRWYRTYKPDPEGTWDGEHPLSFREYIDGKPQPEEITLLDSGRLVKK